MTPDQLRTAIAATGLNNTDFARRLGMTDASYVRKLLRGDSPISDKMAREVRALVARITAPERLFVVSDPDNGTFHVALAPVDVTERVSDGSTWRQSDAWYALVGTFFDVENLRHEDRYDVSPLVDEVRAAIENAEADEDGRDGYLAHAAELIESARKEILK